MKILLSVLFLILLTSCTSSPQKSPTEFKTGKEVAPPYGCTELRKIRKDANC